MPISQKFDIPDLGTINVIKKRGLKRINMRLHHSGEIRVSMPFYLPYSAAIAFAKSHNDWVAKQKQKTMRLTFYDGMKIGKNHQIYVTLGDKISTRVSDNKILVRIPVNISIESPEATLQVKKAVKRALAVEASEILTERVEELAQQYKYSYSKVNTKPMKARWGSCSSTKLISLNIYLLMLPWPIIDYVIMHELAHTKHMNHSKEFWKEIEATTPSYKQIKKTLKELQPQVHALYL